MFSELDFRQENDVAKKPLGYENFIANFQKNLIDGDLHHAWLLSGVAGSGKRTLANYLAHLTLSKNTTHNFSEIANHPDLMVITNEDSKAKNITIDEIRKIKSFLNLTSSLSQYKIVIIDSADDMNVNASNALLKSLEEPNKDTIFFLISHNKDALLDTILSRCNVIDLARLKEQDFTKILEEEIDLSEEHLKLLLKLFPGQPGKAIEFANNKGVEIYYDLTEILSNRDLVGIKKFITDYEFAKDLIKFNICCYIINYLLNAAAKISALKAESQETLIHMLSRIKSSDLCDLFLQFENTRSKVVNLNLDKNSFLNLFLTKLINKSA